MTDPDRFRHLESLYHRCVEAGEAERRRILDELRDRDPRLHGELEGLLRDDAGFLEPPSPSDADPGPAPGSLLGPYRVVRTLGTGGMGRVLLAQREDERFDQQVAIKVVREPRDPQLRVRFERERRALARLAHPNIARLYDGGSTEDGVEYLVMEYVDGRPIDSYCDQHRLEVDARLRLVRTVCRAVHAAHQEWIVHRDLKPSNILVDGEGEPKLLDFGIAKDLGVETAAGEGTRTGQRPLTPEYASPEQVAGEPITTASDVYSLGVLLHHLLTGGSPYRMRSTLLHELERVICEDDPVRPSDAVATSPKAEELAQARGTTPAALRRRLRRDLDTVVLRAMAKRPGDRYASAADLAEDLRRAVEQLPIAARPPSLAYRAERLFRRQRPAVSLALGLVALVLIGGLATLWARGAFADQRQQVEDLGREADTQSQRMSSMRGLMRHVLEGADPFQEADVLSAEVLARAATAVDDPALDPLSEAEFRVVIGRSLRGWGQLEESLRHLDLAVQRAREVGPGGALHALALVEQAACLGSLRRAEPWAAALEEAELVAGQLDPPGPVRVAQVRMGLASLRSHHGEYEAAEALLREVVQDLEALPVQRPAVLGQAFNDLGVMLQELGRSEEAARSLLRAEAEYEIVLSSDHPLLAQVAANLAEVQRSRGRTREARQLAERVLEVRRARFGEGHAQVARAQTLLARIDIDQDASPDAIQRLQQATAILRQQLGPGQSGAGHLELGPPLSALARALRRVGRSEPAAALYAEVLEIALQHHGEDHARTATAQSNLGSTLVDLRRFEEAEPLLQAALSWRLDHGGEANLDTSYTLFSLGMLEWERGQPEAAVAFLERSLAARRAVLPDGHPLFAETLYVLSLPLARLQQSERVAELMEECLDLLQAQEPIPALPLARASCQHAEALALCGEVAEAEARLLDALDQLRDDLNADAGTLGLVERSLARVRRQREG